MICILGRKEENNRGGGEKRVFGRRRLNLTGKEVREGGKREKGFYVRH